MLDAAFARERCAARRAEIDGLALLMDAVRAGLAPPSSPAPRRCAAADEIPRIAVGAQRAAAQPAGEPVGRRAVAGRAGGTRGASSVAAALVREGRWAGATLHKN